MRRVRSDFSGEDVRMTSAPNLLFASLIEFSLEGFVRSKSSIDSNDEPQENSSEIEWIQYTLLFPFGLSTNFELIVHFPKLLFFLYPTRTSPLTTKT
jgi:hypothetical protein